MADAGGRVLPFPRLVVAPLLATITAQEFGDSMKRIAQASAKRLTDPVAPVWLDSTEAQSGTLQLANEAAVPVVPRLTSRALEAFEAMRTFMTRTFPPLWPAMEACLCACGSLLLKTPTSANHRHPGRAKWKR